MKTDGTLIGTLAKPGLGHDLLASQLGVRAESGLQPGVVGITVGKMLDHLKCSQKGLSNERITF